MRLLEIAKSEDSDCTITENLEVKFKDGRVFKIIGNQFINMSLYKDKEVEIEAPEEFAMNVNQDTITGKRKILKKIR